MERIGAGGEGSVWSAWDNEHRRVVAVKFFSQEETNAASDDKGPRTGFLQKLEHPNVRKIYQVGSAGKAEYFSIFHFGPGKQFII